MDDEVEEARQVFLVNWVEGDSNYNYSMIKVKNKDDTNLIIITLCENV